MILGTYDDWREGKRMCPVSADVRKKKIYFSRDVVQDAVARFLKDGGEITQVPAPEYVPNDPIVQETHSKGRVPMGGFQVVEPSHIPFHSQESKNKQVSAGDDCP